jgi:hypothetical protein
MGRLMSAILKLSGKGYEKEEGSSQERPQIGEKPPEEDPVQFIRETLAIQVEITKGLEKLLKEVEV